MNWKCAEPGVKGIYSNATATEAKWARLFLKKIGKEKKKNFLQNVNIFLNSKNLDVSTNYIWIKKY